MRKIELDILKGILIILVVIGHTNIKIPYIDIFWFHMPLFFIATGYLTKRWLSLQSLMIDIKQANKPSINKIFRLLLPYFAYSIILYIVFHPEPVFKNALRVILAGSNNTTIYSYPFWFINALVVANIIYGTIKDSKYVVYILIGIWVLIHLNIIQQSPVPFPWSIDNSLAAVCYIYIGDKAKNYEFKKWHLVFLLLAPFFIIYNEIFDVGYRLNMKSMLYNNVILDLLVPLSFGFCLYCLSLLIAKTNYISKVLSYFSVCSITIFYLHASFLHISQPFFSQEVCVVITLAMCLLIHYTLSLLPATRKLFLGK